MNNNDRAKAIEVKAWKTVETLTHVARLAGFKFVNDPIIADRDGKEYSAIELAKTYKQRKEAECNGDTCPI